MSKKFLHDIISEAEVHLVLVNKEGKSSKITNNLKKAFED